MNNDVPMEPAITDSPPPEFNRKDYREHMRFLASRTPARRLEQNIQRFAKIKKRLAVAKRAKQARKAQR